MTEIYRPKAEYLSIGQISGMNLLEMQALVWRYVCVCGGGGALFLYVCGGWGGVGGGGFGGRRGGGA